MGVLVFLAGQFVHSAIVGLCVQVGVGMFFYLFLAIILNMPQYKQIERLVKK